MLNLKKYMLIKFKNEGRDFSGCDCYGLISLILKEEIGIETPNIKLSCQDPKVNKVTRENNNWIKIDKPQKFAVVLFCTNYPGEIDHFGLCLDNRRFIHINSRMTRPQIALLEDIPWRNYIYGYYIHP